MRLAPPLAAALLLLAAGCAHGPSAKETKTAEIHNDLAVEAMTAGRTQDALREYDIALQADPEMPEALMGRGLVYEYGFDKLAEAEADYRKALLVRPRYSEAHNNLGQLLAKTGRYTEALAEFDKALDDSLYPAPWVARCNRGQALFAMGKRDEGIAELRNCVKITPKYCAGHRALGQALSEQGKVKEALGEFETYARTCDKSADAYQQLGLARMKAGDVAGARTSFEQCVTFGGEGSQAEECKKSLELLK
jgi:type IV pilus biogenesis/stability protein PilW